MKTAKRKSYEKARNILRNNVPKAQRYGKSIIQRKNKSKPTGNETMTGELSALETIAGTDLSVEE